MFLSLAQEDLWEGFFRAILETGVAHRTGIQRAASQSAAGLVRWFERVPSTPASYRSSDKSSSLQSLLTYTPNLTVDARSGPCAPGNTIIIKYKKFDTRDCVSLNGAQVAQLGPAKVLFVDVVDPDGKPSNALVYRYLDNGSDLSFLGTVIYDDSDQFVLNLKDSTVSFYQQGVYKTCNMSWTTKFNVVC